MAKKSPPYCDRITQDPAIMVGKPVVTGTRIPVERVIAHLAETPNLEDLFTAYPELTVDDVRAVLSYARDAVVRRSARSRVRRVEVALARG